MRQCISDAIEEMKKRGVVFPDKSNPEIVLEIYGAYDQIEKTINALVCANTDAKRADAIKDAYHLQWKLHK